MSILSRAGQVTKAVKNVGRLREIVNLMTRFGFGEFAARMGLQGPLPWQWSRGKNTPDPADLPKRIRLLLENLGPTFIKLGQVLAGRPDLIPADIVRELEHLQDDVRPVPFVTLQPIIEADLKRPLSELFLSFDTEPLATASIGQVHAARTLDGEEVVVKIQKPGVERILQRDFEIIEFLANLAERYVPEIKALKPTVIVAEFRKTLLAETDFRMEANNTRRFRENFEKNDFLVVPRVYPELSNAKVLTLEYIHGIKLSDIDQIRRLGIDTTEVLRKGMDSFFQSMMVDGFFHGDPHGGNILITPEGRMALLDFGNVGRFSVKSKDAIINMFLALLTQDYEALIWEYVNLSPSAEGVRNSTNIEKLQREVAEVMAPYFGLPLKEIPTGKILLDSTQIALRNHISLPRDMVQVFKTLMTLEVIGRQLDPNFDLISAASKYARTVLLTRYNPGRLAKDFLFLARDTAELLRVAPRQLMETLRQIESGELKINFEFKQLNQVLRSYQRAQSRIANAILASALLGVAAYSAHAGILPIWAQGILWFAAAVGCIWTIIR